MTVEEILEEVKALPAGEQERLREAMATLAAQREERRALQEVERQLFEAGLLREIKRPITDLTPYRDRKLVEVKGKPISEVIIEERR